MKIEFGCGHKKPKPGFVGCDVRKFPHVKYQCAMWEIGQYVEPESVSHIYSRHAYEHVTFYHGQMTLGVWHQILIPGGRMEMIIPDLEFHIRQMLDPDRKRHNKRFKMSEEQWALNSLFGWQRETDKGQLWDCHKSGYDFPLLKDVLEETGFKHIVRLPNEPHHLHVECFK